MTVKANRILIPLLGFCMLLLYLFLGTNNSYGVQLDEAGKCFYAEGQQIVITAITDEDRNDAPEDTEGKIVKITCYNQDDADVAGVYYVTDEYTVYGGGMDSDYATTSISMYSGTLHRIVAGSPAGHIDYASVVLSGGSVDQIVPVEDGETYTNSISISNDATGLLDVWIGAEKDHSGRIDSISLDAEENPNVTLHMGYSGGRMISELNESAKLGENYVSGTIKGSKLSGLETVQEIPGFLVNNKLTIRLDSREGRFSDGKETKRYSVTFPEDSYSVEISSLPVPERKGYLFKGWISSPGQLTPEKEINRGTGYLYASWKKTDDPEPYDLNLTYYDSKTGDEMEVPVSLFTGNSNNQPITKNYDKSKGLVLSGYYPDGTSFSKKLEDYDPQTGIWYYALTSESPDKTTQKTYILSFYESESDANNFSWASVIVYDPESYDESTGNYDELYEYSVDNLEAMSKEGATIELPYRSLQKKWTVRFLLQINDEGSGAGIKDGEDYVLNYDKEIELDGSTNVSKTYEVKTEDGQVHDYRIHLVEGDGASADLSDLGIYTWDGASYDEDGNPKYIGKAIDLGSAATEKGTTVAIPYYYDEEKCGEIEVFCVPDEPGMKISGLEESYTLDSNGEREIRFSATSANGKNTKHYKVKLVKDKKGDSTEMETLYLHYIEWSNDDSGEDIKVPINMEAAKTETGATVTAPVNAAVNSAYFFVQGETENYGIVDLSGYDYIDWEPDIYQRPDKYNKTNDSVVFTVTSADKKHTQKYKVTVWQKDAKTFKDLSKVTISGIEDKEYTGSPIRQNPVLMDGAKKLTEGTDYTVAYKNNTQAGTASVIFTGMGDYTGSVTKQFRIYQPAEPDKGLFTDSNTIRLAGGTRYDTAIETADALKKSLDVDKFENIIVASGGNYPDALTGSYLAKMKNAPILLVDNSSALLVKDYVRRNLKSGGTVYILGGTGAVSGTFENSLKNADLSVKRLAGKSRYDTNISILKEAGVKKSDLLICSGNGFADSLSASAAGLPILLVDKNVSSVQKSYLDGLSIDKLYLIGGLGAVNASVEKSMKQYGAVERLAGKTRYDTSKAVAEKFFKGKSEVAVIAYGQNFPDGLAGGPLAMSLNAPLLLAENGAYSQAASFVKEEGIQKGVVLGGSALISNPVLRQIIK